MITIARIPKEWFLLEPHELGVTCDHDDVLMPITKTVAKRAGVEYGKLCNFVFERNPLITLEQAHRLRELYRDPSIIYETPYAEDAREILRFQQLGLVLDLKSHSASKSFRGAKIQRIGETFPEIPNEHVELTINDDLATNLEKKLRPNTLVFIDDSPYYVANSTAPINILIRQPWNVTDEAKSMLTAAQLPIVAWRNTVTEAVDFACEQIKLFLRFRSEYLKRNDK